MASTISVKGARFPIHRIRLEGFEKPRPANVLPSPIPAVELESTPYGHIKIKIGSAEVMVSGDVLLKAVATLIPERKH